MLNSIKTQASALAELFKSHGVELSRSQSLDYLAKVYGLSDFNELAPRAKPIEQEIQDFLRKSFRAEDQLRMNGSALECAVGLTLAKKDQSLEELSAQVAQAAYKWKASQGEVLRDFEISHVKNSNSEDADYGDECVVRTVSGFSLAASAYPNEVDYLRVINPQGQELMYWSIDEIQEDPAEVLGAVIGALRPSGATVAKPLRQPALRGYRGLDYSFEGAPDGDGKFTGSYVDFRLYRNMDEPKSNLGAEVRLHVFIDCQEECLVLGDVSFSPSRQDDFESTPVPSSAIELLLAELNDEGVVEDTAQSMLDALRKQQPRYTGWIFTAADLKETLVHKLQRLRSK